MIDVTPLFAENTPIPSHAIAALLGVILGVAQVLLPKGGMRHRLLGWLFVVCLSYTAVSAALISEIKLWGYFSPIHLLIPITLLGLWGGIRAARARNIEAHRKAMLSLFLLALLIPGAFTLLPGRVMHDVVFAPAAQ